MRQGGVNVDKLWFFLMLPLLTCIILPIYFNEKKMIASLDLSETKK